jgi:ubiquinone biosynthesis protein
MQIGFLSMLRALFRLPHIGWHLGRAGVLGHIGRITLLPNWLRRICTLLDRLVRSQSATRDAGGALAEALTRLGPGFIKFGQALSTRADLMGPEMTYALTLLQDRLPPFSGRIAQQSVERETGQSLDDIFSSFDRDAVAAASVAQVHKAVLRDGRAVAVKLLRPDIERQMRADTSLFFSLALILQWLAPGLERLKLVTAVEQFVQLSDMELDLRLEAAAAGRLADNLADDDGIYVPWVDVER